MVTPEFGPVPYAPAHPATGEALRDVWEINCAMPVWLAERLA